MAAHCFLSDLTEATIVELPDSFDVRHRDAPYGSPLYGSSFGMLL